MRVGIIPVCAGSTYRPPPGRDLRFGFPPSIRTRSARSRAGCSAVELAGNEWYRLDKRPRGPPVGRLRGPFLFSHVSNRSVREDANYLFYRPIVAAQTLHLRFNLLHNGSFAPCMIRIFVGEVYDDARFPAHVAHARLASFVVRVLEVIEGLSQLPGIIPACAGSARYLMTVV